MPLAVKSLVGQLQAIKDRALVPATIDGFGEHLSSAGCPCSQVRAQASAGEYSLDQALADHIAEVEQMRDVYLAVENRYTAADEANTAALAGSASAME
ncbi:hypothetical protein LCL87_20970 [Rhodococcus hoagii]|nr:hypothetical protein [Prescottella equi]